MTSVAQNFFILLVELLYPVRSRRIDRRRLSRLSPLPAVLFDLGHGHHRVIRMA